MSAKRSESYVAYRRRSAVRESDLAGLDEDESAAFSWDLIKRFGPYIAPYRGAAIASAVLMVVSTLANLATPLLIGKVINLVQYGCLHDASGLTGIGLLLLFVNVVAWQAQYWQVWTMSWAGQQMLYKLSSDMFAHLQRLSLSFYDRTEIGPRLQSDIAVLENMLSSGLLSILGSLIALVGIVGIMLVVNVGLALLAFTVLPVMVIIAAFWQRYAQRSFRRTRAAISLVNSTLQENISGMRVIQGLAREGRNSEEFDDLNRYNRDTNVESGRIAALILPLIEVVAAVATALVIIYGGILVMHGQLKTGDLVAFILYINRFFDPIRDLSQQYTQLQRGGVASERIFQILGVPVTIKDKPGARALPPIDGAAAFSHVDFAYTPDHPVLRDLNLRIEAGQTVAIVGPTGAGKSTISALLARFYDVSGGTVRIDGIDGIDVRDVTQQSLRSQIGIVLQDPFLFTGTVRENIRYGRLDASDADVERAARVVGAHDLITHLPRTGSTPWAMAALDWAT
jgi:ABC-type multidrug transport system fused ATPase/permease subunit